MYNIAYFPVNNELNMNLLKYLREKTI